MENLPKPKFTHENTADGVKIVIPAVKRWSVLIFVGIWFCAWSILGSTVVDSLYGDGDDSLIFIFIWTVGWTVGWVAALCFIIWQVFGKETVVVNDARMTWHRTVFISFPKRQYAIAKIENFDVTDAKDERLYNIAYDEKFFGESSLCFDYGSCTVEFAFGLDVAEAREIMKLIKSYLPKDRSA